MTRASIAAAIASIKLAYEIQSYDGLDTGFDVQVIHCLKPTVCSMFPANPTLCPILPPRYAPSYCHLSLQLPYSTAVFVRYCLPSIGHRASLIVLSVRSYRGCSQTAYTEYLRSAPDVCDQTDPNVSAGHIEDCFCTRRLLRVCVLFQRSF